MQRLLGVSFGKRILYLRSYADKRYMNGGRLYRIPENIVVTSSLRFHIKPNSDHRIYAKATKSSTAKKLLKKNKFTHKLLVSLFLGFSVLSLYTIYQCLDFVVPVSHRKRFLIVPQWMDSVLAAFFIKYLFVYPEDKILNKETIEWDFTEGAAAFTEKVEKQKSENDLMELCDKEDEYYILCHKLFKKILKGNNLIKDDEEKHIHNKYKNELSRFHNLEWEINVIEDYMTINAFSIPNGKIFFFKGIFFNNIVSNENECAAIMCHEIAHCLARHCMEEIQLKMLLLSVIYFCGFNFGIDTSFFMDKIALIWLKNILLELPLSKYCEYEADKIGMTLYQNAGYNCNKYVDAFTKLALFENNIDEALQLFSTHPLTRDRIERIKQNAQHILVTNAHKTTIIDEIEFK